MAMKKKPFDAVAESRRWRRTTSRLLDRMTPAEQIAFLNRRLTAVRPTRARKLVAAN